MRRFPVVPRDERGIALVMAMVMLVVIAALAVVLMVNLNVERKISGHDVRQTSSLNLADAGVGEALARIRDGDITLANPQSVAQIFLTNAGSVPVLGTDSTAMETKQPAGQWLNYSRATNGPDILTVEYKTNAARTVIYKYDNTRNPAIQAVSGLPIYHITSTGIEGSNRSRIVTDVIQKPFNAMLNGAFTAAVPIQFTGNAYVCGHNHSGSTPPGTRDPANCAPYETGSGDLPPAWSTGGISTGGSANTNPAAANAPNQTGFYAGPWTMLQMGQSEFFSWSGLRSPPSRTRRRGSTTSTTTRRSRTCPATSPITVETAKACSTSTAI